MRTAYRGPERLSEDLDLGLLAPKSVHTRCYFQTSTASRVISGSYCPWQGRVKASPTPATHTQGRLWTGAWVVFATPPWLYFALLSRELWPAEALACSEGTC